MRELDGPENPEVSRVLAVMAARMRDENAPAHVEAALLAKFRERHARRSKAPHWWAAAVASVAAAGLIAALFVAPRSARVEALPAPRLAHAAAPVIPVPPAVRASRNVIKKPVRRTTAAAPRGEVASDFFPLGPGPLVDAGESASLVRVSLPRSVMRRFGFPQGNDPFESVQADVVLGHDGMARAVRFVSVRR